MPDAALPVPASPQAPPVGPPAPRRATPGKVVRFSYRLPAVVSAGLKTLSSSGLSWLDAFSGPLRPSVVGAAPDSEELIDGYTQEPWVAGCVDIFGLAVALLRLRAYDRDPDEAGAKEVTEGPILELLRRPCETIAGEALLRIHDAQNVSLTGESFWFLQDENGDPVMAMGDGPAAIIDLPAAIVPVRGDLVSAKAHPSRPVPGWWRVPSSKGGTREWPSSSVEQLFEFPDPSPYRSWRGIGRLAKAFGPTSQNHLARRYQNFLLRNAGDPGGVVTIDGVIGPEEYERMRAEIDDEWNTPERAGDTRLLWGGAKYAEGRRTPRDLQYGELRKANKDDISAVFSTPPALLGVNAENFATFAGHWKVFTRLRVLPWIVRLTHTLNGFLARLRDPELRMYRVRFDTELLSELFADPGQQSKLAGGLVDLGVPLDEALRQGGIKTDPIAGGDVSMIKAGYQDRLAAIAQSRARAAAALQLAGVERRAALDHVGLAELPHVEPEPAASPPAPPSAAGGGKALPGPADPPAGRRGPSSAREAVAAATGPGAASQGRPEPARPVETKAADAQLEAQRLAAWQGMEKRRRPLIRRMDRAVKRIFRDMLTAQLRAFEEFAEEGQVKRAAAYDFTGCAARLRADQRAEDLPSLPALWPGPTPRMTATEGRALLAAWKADREEERALARAAISKLFREVETCCGLRSEYVPWRPRCDAWLNSRRGLARVELSRLVEVAQLAQAQWTEEQIDQLLILQDARWRDALVDKIHPVVADAYAAGAAHVVSLLGTAIIDVKDADVLRAIRAHDFKVVEGVQSTVARRTRADIISVLVDGGGLGDLQQAVKDTLEELQATTTRAFKDHYARAEAIARTEVGRGSSQGDHAQLVKDFNDGVLAAFEWITLQDDAVRSSHQAMHGQRTTPPNPYVSGKGNTLVHPGDPNGAASEVIRCRCSEWGILADDD